MSSHSSWKQKCSFLFLMATLLTSLGGCNSKITQTNTAKNNSSEQNSGVLETIKKRGYLICGISGEIPGFSFVDFNSKYAGMDVDFCRAVASALFDDPDRVKFRELDIDNRFTALKSGEIDLLSRNTTQTLSRDIDGDLEFTPPIYYDAQGIMVHQDSGIKNINDLKGESICVAEGTTSYDNLTDYMAQAGIEYTPLLDSDKESLYNSYEYNRCQAITGDISQLVARKILLANPNDHRILEQKIGQEPLAPVVVHGDSRWFDVVKWVTFALIEAEELNINSSNLSLYKNSSDLEIKNFLGKNGELGSKMGLSNDFTFRIIRHVGNYQEIYDRNIGQPFDLKRGQNALWQNGGLMYSPPFN